MINHPNLKPTTSTILLDCVNFKLAHGVRLLWCENCVDVSVFLCIYKLCLMNILDKKVTEDLNVRRVDIEDRQNVLPSFVELSVFEKLISQDVDFRHKFNKT